MGRWGFANTAHKWLNVPDHHCGVYNGWDCYWTAKLLPCLIDEANELGQWEWWQEHGFPFQYAVLDMSRRGLLIDRPTLNTYRAAVRQELHNTDQAICDAADLVGFTYTDKFPNSRDQVAKLLFTTLGLRGSKQTSKGKRPSVDQDALTRVLRDLRVRDEPHRHLLYNLFHRTRLFTILTRYLDLDPDEDGRIRPIIKMAHVKTGRLAYAEPALQQFPDEARHVFVTQPGHLFLSVDYSQLELRLLTYYSNDNAGIKVFEQGGDPHAANARDLFNITLEQWTAHPNPEPARTYAKTWAYRTIYGGSAASGDKKLFCPCPKCALKMPSTLHLSPKEAALNEERWHARHPAVKQWQAKVASEVRRTHKFPLLMGGFRYLSSPWNRDMERELKNIPMQSGAARIMIRAQNKLHHLGAPIILQHHDSFLLEVSELSVGTWTAAVREVMEEPVEVGGYKASLPVDIKVGRNWGRHSAENPEGLRKPQ